MGLENFIPELWSTRINAKLLKDMVYIPCANTAWQGEISGAGSVVRINEVMPPTISSYTRNSTLTYETLESAQTLLAIDNEYSFSFKVADMDTAQSNTSFMDEAMRQAASGLRDKADAYIAALYTKAGSAMSSTAVESTNVLATLYTLWENLTEGNCPTEGRWCVVPPWFGTKIRLAKALYEKTTDTALDNGFIGRAAGFDIYESNNVSNDATTYQIMAGTNKAIAFAGQVWKIETLVNPNDFGQLVRGLYAFGANVVQPYCLAVCPATVGSEP